MANEHEGVTLLPEFLKINQMGNADYITSNINLAGGMLGVLHVQGASDGTTHRFPRTTKSPVVGFRKPGKGRTNTPGERELVNIDLNILDATAREDCAIADAYKRGPEAYMEMRSFENLAVGLDTAERQFIYGTEQDTDGFLGLVDNDFFKYKDSVSVFDGESTGDVEDIWLIRSGEMDVSLIGNESMPLDFGNGELITETLKDQEGKEFVGYTAPLKSWLGMQVGSVNSALRIANVDPKGSGIEDMIIQALGRVPDRKPFTHIVMSRTARSTIQRSRTTFNDQGRPANTPSVIDSRPIVTSEAIAPRPAIVADPN